MTNGADTKQALQALVVAALELADLHGMTRPTPAAVATSPAPAVTKTVTQPAPEQRKPADTAPDDPAMDADAPERVELPTSIKPRELVDPDTVRMERIPSRIDDNRSKMVLAGHGDGTRLVGFLEPHGIQQKKWDAFAPGRIRMEGGPFRTRQEALIRLLYLHVPSKTRRGRKRQPS